MAVITRSIELPLPARRARELAAVPEVMQFVLAPVLAFSMEQSPPLDTSVEPGFSATGRVMWLGVVPSWTHEITVVRLDDYDIRTREHGGPVRVWNHRLTFAPLTTETCRYTDQVEVEDGFQGWVTALFVRLILRHRHRRWRLLATVLAAEKSRNGAASTSNDKQ